MIQKLTWVKDASMQYEWVPGGHFAVIDTHEFDDVLHVFVVYASGAKEEWSRDWGDPLPSHLAALIDEATRG